MIVGVTVLPFFLMGRNKAGKSGRVIDDGLGYGMKFVHTFVYPFFCGEFSSSAASNSSSEMLAMVVAMSLMA